MHFANNRDHAVPFFKNTNNLPINMLYVETVSKLMYHISHNSVPINVMDLFTQVATVHSYNTKSSTAGNYQIKSSRTNQQHNAFSRVGAKVWNSVTQSLRNLKKKDFTRKIHTLLIEIMNNEDDYVDLPMILQIMSV